MQGITFAAALWESYQQYRENRENRKTQQSAITYHLDENSIRSIRIQEEEVKRFTDNIRKQLAQELTARAEKIERFLA